MGGPGHTEVDGLVLLPPLLALPPSTGGTRRRPTRLSTGPGRGPRTGPGHGASRLTGSQRAGRVPPSPIRILRAGPGRAARAGSVSDLKSRYWSAERLMRGPHGAGQCRAGRDGARLVPSGAGCLTGGQRVPGPRRQGRHARQGRLRLARGHRVRIRKIILQNLVRLIRHRCPWPVPRRSSIRAGLQCNFALRPRLMAVTAVDARASAHRTAGGPELFDRHGLAARVPSGTGTWAGGVQSPTRLW